MLRRALSKLAVAGLILLLAAAAGLWWLGTDAGLRFILARVQSSLAAAGNTLRLDGVSGGLYRGIHADRFEWLGGGMEAAGTGLAAQWSLPALLRRQLLIRQLVAETVTVKLAPAQPEPAARERRPMPGAFGLPITVELPRFAIGELRVTPPAAGDAPPQTLLFSEIDAEFAYRDALFRLDHFNALTPYGRLLDATVQIGDAPPHPIRADLGFQGTLEKIAFDLRLKAEGDLEHVAAAVSGSIADATVKVEAALEPLAVMPLTSAKANLAALDLQRLLPAAPQTLVDAEVSLASSAQAGSGWTGRVGLRNAAVGALPDGRLPVAGLDTAFLIHNLDDPQRQQVQLRDLQVTLGDKNQPGDPGRITGSVDVFPGRTLAVAGASIPEIEAALAFEAIDIAQFKGELPRTALGGSLDLKGDDFALNLTQSQERMRTLMPSSVAGAAADARIAVRGRIDETVLRLQEATIHLGKTSLHASGEAGLSAPHRIVLKGEARQVELAQWLPRDPAIDERFRTGLINGKWSVDGTVAPGLDARLTLALTDSTLADRPLAADLRTHLVLASDWAPLRLNQTAADLRHGKNSLRANGALGRSNDKLALDLVVAEPELLDPRMTGRLALDGDLAGAFDRLQARLLLTGDRLSLKQAEGKVSMQSLRIEARGPASADIAPQQAPLDIAIRLRGVKAADRELDALDLKVNGSLASHRFALTAAGEGNSAQVNGQGHATLAPAPSWQARLASTRIDGPVPLRQTAPADLRIDTSSARLDRFNIDVAGGQVNLERLVVDWGAARAFDLRGTGRDLPVSRLLALADSANDTSPGLEALQALRLDADWNLKGSGAEDLDGTASLVLREVAEAGRPGATRLGLPAGNGVQVKVSSGRLDGRFDLTLPSLAFTHPLTAPDLVLDGSLRVAGSVGGTVVQPLWDARLNGKDLTVLQRLVGWRLSNGVLDARLEGRALQLQTLKFESGEGSVALAGQARLLDAPRAPAAGGKAPASVLPLDGRFELTAASFEVPLGPGQRVALSGTTVLESGPKGLTLGGKLRADNGIIEIQGSAAPTLPPDVTLVDVPPGVAGASASVKAAGAGAEGKAPKAGADVDSKLRILTDLAIDLGDKLRVTGDGISARLGGDLRVLGTLPNDPRLTGVVNILEGSYQAYGQNLYIQKGAAVRFNGPIDNPSLDIVARRPLLPVQVGISVTGTALDPEITLISTPEMSETDKLSWLVLGTDPKNAPDAAQSLALREAARSLLLQDDGSYKPSIAERLGLDIVNFGYGSDAGPAQAVTERINPTGLPGGQIFSSAEAAQREVVTLGKRIGSRLFVTYEHGLRGLYHLLRIQYSLTQRLSLRAQSGSDNAVDLLYSYSFD